MKMLKKLMLVLVVATLSITFGTQEVAADTSLGKGTSTMICKDGETTSKTECDNAKPLAERIETVVKTFTGLVGAFAVGMIVYGGFKYITSQGDPKAAEGAKNVIWYSGVGLFIVLVAFIIFDLLAKAMV